MAGRFLTLPTIALACVIAARPALFEAPSGALLVVLPFVILYLAPGATEEWPVLQGIKQNGIADERGFYRSTAGLMVAKRRSSLPRHSFRREGERLRKSKRVVASISHAGYLGYFAGPKVHLIDRYGLNDPLLARLPVADPIGFRIGHFRRSVPRGYERTVKTGRCAMSRDLCRYYGDLRLVTRGDLVSWERFGAIVRLNLGLDEHLLNDIRRQRATMPGPDQDEDSNDERDGSAGAKNEP